MALISDKIYKIIVLSSCFQIANRYIYGDSEMSLYYFHSVQYLQLPLSLLYFFQYMYLPSVVEHSPISQVYQLFLTDELIYYLYSLRNCERRTLNDWRYVIISYYWAYISIVMMSKVKLIALQKHPDKLLIFTNLYSLHLPYIVN